MTGLREEETIETGQACGVSKNDDEDAPTPHEFEGSNESRGEDNAYIQEHAVSDQADQKSSEVGRREADVLKTQTIEFDTTIDSILSKSPLHRTRYVHDGVTYELRVLEGGDGVVWSDLDALIQGSNSALGHKLPQWAFFLTQEQKRVRDNGLAKFRKHILYRPMVVYTLVALAFIDAHGPPGASETLRSLCRRARLPKVAEEDWTTTTFLLAYQDIHNDRTEEILFPEDATYVYECENSQGIKHVLNLRVKSGEVEVLPILDMLMPRPDPGWSEGRRKHRAFMAMEGCLFYRDESEYGTAQAADIQWLLDLVGLEFEPSARWKLDSEFHLRHSSDQLTCGGCFTLISRILTTSTPHNSCRHRDGIQRGAVKKSEISAGKVRECTPCRKIFMSVEDWEDHQAGH